MSIPTLDEYKEYVSMTYEGAWLSSAEDFLARSLPTPTAVCGVYLLFCAGRVVYVGQSVNVDRRVIDHVAAGEKSFDRYTVIPLPRERLDMAEAVCIARFRPKLNSVLPPCLGYASANTIKGAMGVGAIALKRLARDGRVDNLTLNGTTYYRCSDVAESIGAGGQANV